jgi:hypothetical protein
MTSIYASSFPKTPSMPALIIPQSRWELGSWVEERWLKNLAILELLRRIPWNSLQHLCCVGELSWSAGLEKDES